MSLIDYTFLLRSDGSFRPVQRSCWLSVLEKKRSLPDAARQHRQYVEIKLQMAGHKPQAIYSIKLWDLSFDSLGYVEKKSWQMRETPPVSGRLDTLLQKSDVRARQQLSDLLSAMMGGSSESAEQVPVMTEQALIETLLAKV